MTENAQAKKVKENRLRRMADRQGFRLDKCRRRDPLARGYGTYGLTEPYKNSVAYCGVNSDGYGLTLDEVEAILKDGVRGIMAKD